MLKISIIRLLSSVALFALVPIGITLAHGGVAHDTSSSETENPTDQKESPMGGMMGPGHHGMMMEHRKKMMQMSPEEREQHHKMMMEHHKSKMNMDPEEMEQHHKMMMKEHQEMKHVGE